MAMHTYPVVEYHTSILLYQLADTRNDSQGTSKRD